MKDYDMRKILKRWILNKKDVIGIREEMPSGSTRFDITAFKKNRIIGYEIKSDSDILDRLFFQIKEYERVCEFCYVVVGEKYEYTIFSHVPDEWGIILIKENRVIVLRKALRNSHIDTKYMLSLCWKDEIYPHIRHLGVKRNKYKGGMIEIASNNLSYKEIKNMVITYAMNKRVKRVS